MSFEDTPGDDDYNRNIQIADLNALNAAFAVIKWKKLFGFYRISSLSITASSASTPTCSSTRIGRNEAGTHPQA